MKINSGAPTQRYRTAASRPQPLATAHHAVRSAPKATMANRIRVRLRLPHPTPRSTLQSTTAYSTGVSRHGVPGACAISENRCAVGSGQCGTPTMTTTTATTRSAISPSSAGRAEPLRRSMTPARSDADILGDEIVLRRELVADPARPETDQGRQHDEDRARHHQDDARPARASLDPDHREDQRRHDEAEVIRDVVQRERTVSEIIGHRLLRDRVRLDLPEEERREA